MRNDNSLELLEKLEPVIPLIYDSIQKFKEMLPEGAILSLPFGVGTNLRTELYLKYDSRGIEFVRGTGNYEYTVMSYFYNSSGLGSLSTEIDYKSEFMLLSGEDATSVAIRLDAPDSQNGVYSSIMPCEDWISINGSSQTGIEEAMFQHSLLDNIRDYDTIMSIVNKTLQVSEPIHSKYYLEITQTGHKELAYISKIPEILF